MTRETKQDNHDASVVIPLKKANMLKKKAQNHEKSRRATEHVEGCTCSRLFGA